MVAACLFANMKQRLLLSTHSTSMGTGRKTAAAYIACGGEQRTERDPSRDRLDSDSLRNGGVNIRHDEMNSRIKKTN